MNPAGDDGSNMDLQELDDRKVEALLAGRDVPGEQGLAAALRLIRSTVALEAPAPSAALVAVLQDGLALPGPAGLPSRARRGAQAGGVAAAVMAALALTVGAAAADVLPAPLQTKVADIVGRLTPIDLPRRAGDAPPSDTSGSDGTDAEDGEAGRGGDDEPGRGVQPVGPARTGESAGDVQDSDEVEADSGRGIIGDQQDTDEPDTDRPDGEVPSGDASDADQPDADEPDSERPASDAPSGDEPDADQPDSGEPSTDASSGGATTVDGPNGDEPASGSRDGTADADAGSLDTGDGPAEDLAEPSEAEPENGGFT